MTNYSLQVSNESSNRVDVCVFQKPPDIGLADVFPLAWLAQPAHPTTRIAFKWSLDYSFVWDETGTLRPGVVFDASQVWSADPSDTAKNAVTLEYTEGAFTFAKDKGQATGHLYVKEAGNVPAGEASVGVGMSGNGTYAVQAQPNLNLVFTPHPNYWLAAGNFEEGQVLDLETITNPVEVPFPDNVYGMSATLNSDNTWTVGPTH